VRYYGQAEVQVAERQGALQLVHVNLAAMVRVHHVEELRASRQPWPARRAPAPTQHDNSVNGVHACKRLTRLT